MQHLSAARAQEQLNQLLAQVDIQLPASATSPHLPAALQTFVQSSLVAVKKRLDQAHQRKAAQQARAAQQAADKQASSPAWLSDNPTTADEQGLQQAREQEAMLQAHMQQQQHADMLCGDQLQTLREQQQRTAAALQSGSSKLSSSLAALKQLNAQTNRKLQQLLAGAEEGAKLVHVHGANWLLKAADVSQCARLNTLYNEDMLKAMSTLQQDGTGQASMGGSQGAQHADAVCDLRLLDPFGCGTAGGGGAGQLADTCAAEVAATREELARIRLAHCLTEKDLIIAEANVAGKLAMLAAVRQMLVEQQPGVGGRGSSYAPWLHPAECDRLSARVQALQKELNKLSEVELPTLIDELSSKKDTFVQTGAAEMRTLRQDQAVRAAQSVTHALLAWGVQVLAMDTLRMQERAQLSDLYRHIMAAISMMHAALTAMQQRADAYAQVHSSWVAQSAWPAASTQSARHGSATQSSGGDRMHGTSAAGKQGQARSFLDVLHGKLRDQQGHEGTTSILAANLKSVVTALQQLHHRSRAAQAAALGLSETGLPQMVALAVRAAQALHGLLCGRGAPHVAPIMVDPRVTHALATQIDANTELQERLNTLVRSCNAYNDFTNRKEEQAKLERKVFELFHTAPSLLMEEIERLQQRLDALKAA